MILHHAINTAEMFTSLDIEQHKTNLLQCALSSELAQSYIILYELFTNIDPALAQALIHYNDNMSVEQMKSTYPILGSLVGHIISYIKADI